MKRILWIGAIIILLIVAGWWGYAAYFQPDSAGQTGEEAADGDAEMQGDLANVIWASGKLEPMQWTELSPANGGAVAQIHVAEGEWVEADQVLIDLQNDVWRGELERARAAQSEAEAALAQLLAGATEAEIDAQEANVAAAEANLQLAIGHLQETNAAVDSARAQVTAAQRAYSELASHPTDTERQVARAEVAIADAAVRQAQAAYNLARGDPQISARPESRALYEATAALEAAKARQALTEAGATAEELAVAQSQIEIARAEVNAVQSRVPAAEAEVMAAMAQLQSAQSALDKMLAGPTDEEIAMAQARVESARAAMSMARANLRQSQVVAPFAGQVGAIHPHVGEMATPGQPLVLLGDTRQMCVRTTDLRETDVVHLSAGMPVEVTFDALPDQVFRGTVMEIAPVSTSEKGSTNYTVELDVADLSEALRWGMTAFVNIQPDEQPGGRKVSQWKN